VHFLPIRQLVLLLQKKNLMILTIGNFKIPHIIMPLHLNLLTNFLLMDKIKLKNINLLLAIKNNALKVDHLIPISYCHNHQILLF